MVEEGKVYRTPFEPSGLFRVTYIEHGTPPTAFGVYVGNHPHGYFDGTIGRYFVSDLEGREEPEE